MPTGVYERTLEGRINMGKAMKGRIPWNKGNHIYCGGRRFEKGNIPWSKGKKRPDITGDKNPMWKGGKTIHSAGYVQIYMPMHPFADNHGYVFEHRLVMEKHIGRILTKNEIAHHINHVKADNRIENLSLMTNSDHNKLPKYRRIKNEKSNSRDNQKGCFFGISRGTN